MDNASPSERVIYAVAEQTDTHPERLPPLFDTINPDALDRLLQSVAHGEVRFQYAGQTVTVESDGTVRATDTGITHAPQTD